MIYITGDTHGDFNFFKDRNVEKILKSDDILIICGDFGFIWDGSKKENQILNKIGRFPFKVLFVDGKHENFDILNSFGEDELFEGRVHKICGNLYHLMRGEIYNMEEKKFFVFGGGQSLDKELRSEQGRWWKEEMPTFDEISSAARKLNKIKKEVDYIVTHEPPGYIKNISNKNKDEISFMNDFFDSISKEVAFKRWFFGSFHLDKKITDKHLAVFDRVVPISEKKKKGLIFRKQV